MIRINLLGVPKPKGKKKGVPAFTMPSLEFSPGSPAVLAAVAVALVALGNGLYWYKLDREKKSIAEHMQVAQARNAQLAIIQTKYLERQKQADAYKRRVDVIDQLRNNQSGPVSLLSMVADTVNGTEAVWINSMQDQGASVAIDGTALSSDAVANLITNLQKTGYFKNIEMKESVQDDAVRDMQAFQFTLTCEKAKS
jgi:Tfp pilus assembly protein PilN